MSKEIIDKILISHEDIVNKTNELARRINDDYRNEETPIMVCVLKGAVMFFADLVQHIDIDVAIDFIAISSYGNTTRSSGEVKMVKDLSCCVEGRNIIIVEDIIDSGYTMHYLMNSLNIRGAKSVKLCSLLSKPSRRVVPVEIDYLGFEIPDEFAIGYGLDFDERYRNLKDICVLRLED
ncbi:MAG: hypoxanthine phosphoribosyltransferase [Clostridia bacterium]|nr:hypoxanthine phosphoribosyltransferase [Clostridia bacterium]